MRVAIVAEYYPRAADPVLGVWAHRQALAARDAGADVRVLVLHRPVPSKAALRSREPRGAARAAAPAAPRHARRHPRSPTCRSSRRRGRAPTAAGARGRRRASRWRSGTCAGASPSTSSTPTTPPRRATRCGARGPACPLVVSVHGGDVLSVARRAGGRAAVTQGARRRPGSCSPTPPAPSSGRGSSARPRRASCTSAPTSRREPSREPALPTIATVGHLVARKRHADVLRALWLLRDSHPDLRWVVAGDGPERPALERMIRELELGGRVTLRGQLPPARGARRGAGGDACSRCRASTRRSGSPTSRRWRPASRPSAAVGEAGPEEIAASGPGIRLVPPGDPEALADELRTLLDDAAYRRELGDGARATVERAFTWEACGRATVAAYEEALR